MIRVLMERFRQKHRTFPYPGKEPVMPPHFCGRPRIDWSLCSDQSCRAECESVCPVGAVSGGEKRRMQVDLGRCIFCRKCELACPKKAIVFTPDYKLAARAKQDLILSREAAVPRLDPLKHDLRKILGRSLKLRQVSAAGCNACEADTNVLGTPVFDLGRFGIQFVASPRHADGLLITGPVSQNMKLALQKTYDATPSPKIVIATGACAISGGLFRDHPEVCNGVEGLLPVDLFIPGCPPHPMTILHGLLRLLGRIE